jgi:hypothetical protein
MEIISSLFQFFATRFYPSGAVGQSNVILERQGVFSTVFAVGDEAENGRFERLVAACFLNED